jgi:hypothetical protein
VYRRATPTDLSSFLRKAYLIQDEYPALLLAQVLDYIFA